MSKKGKNWAICVEGDDPEYIPGTDAHSAATAEEIWRKWRKLYFIAATVRRTTISEDAALQEGLKDSQPERPNPLPGIFHRRSPEIYQQIVKEVNTIA